MIFISRSEPPPAFARALAHEAVAVLDWSELRFTKFDLKVDAPLYPDFTLPKTPKPAGGPDPNGPNPKPQGPQCQPKLGDPDPVGCEN